MIIDIIRNGYLLLSLNSNKINFGLNFYWDKRKKKGRQKLSGVHRVGWWRHVGVAGNVRVGGEWQTKAGWVPQKGFPLSTLSTPI